MPKLDDVSTGDYVIPIYTDIDALIDVLASIEGGFSAVETFRSTDAELSNSEKGASVTAALHLLKINLIASKRTEAGQTEELTGQRYHSPGSLLNRLRRHLRDNELLKRAPPWENLIPSDFVEFRGVFRQNSVSQTLTTVRRTVELMTHWAGGKSGKQSGGNYTPKQMIEMTDAILNDLNAGERYLFIVESPGAPKIVAPVSRALLRDRTLGEIANGEFRVTGKIVRRLTDPAGERLQLFPGSAIAAVRPIMNSVIEAFKFLGDAGMSVPTIDDSELQAPALVVLPIGISI